MSSDYGDMCRDLKEQKRALRAAEGVECPVCKVKRPRTNASILLPGQRCKVDRYVDPRPRPKREGLYE